MAHGLSMVLHPEDLIIAVNVGDDFTYLGRICPDLDTVMYTLAGLANPETGWGIEGETWNVMNSIKSWVDQIGSLLATGISPRILNELDNSQRAQNIQT